MNKYIELNYIETVFCIFLELKKFWKIYGYMLEYTTFSFMILKNDSQIVNILKVKSFSRLNKSTNDESANGG